tara:strand:+ start:748 stop:1008 length:261 start_codon:yes stop_codon:yes gene_type:complete
MTPDKVKKQIQSVRTQPGNAIAYVWAEGCTLTDEQKADIESSNIIHKWATQIPAYLNELSDIRAGDPAMSDRMARRLAKVGLQVGS